MSVRNQGDTMAFTANRMLTMDQHFPDAPYISFDAFSAEEEARNVRAAGFDSLFIFTKCHWGYCYHPTRIGVPHPKLRGRDMVGELVHACRAQGVSPTAYHSIVFDQAMTRLHPEWRLLNSRGEPVIWNREGNPLFAANAGVDSGAGAQAWRFPEACINTGYREFTLGLIDEIADYAIDGLFIDIFGVTTSCFCPSCLALYRAKGIDPYSARREDVFDRIELWWERWESFMVDIRRLLDAHRPGIALSINGTMPGRILRHATFPYSEGGEHPHNMDILRGCRMPTLQGGIGYPMVDPLSTDEMMQRTSTVLAHGGRLLYFCGPGRGVDGRIEPRWYEYMAPVNAATRRIEPFLEGAQPLPAAAVYHHDANASDIGTDHYLSWMNLWRGSAGILAAFRRIHLPGDFLPNWRCTAESLAGYRFVVVPDVTCLGDADIALLEGYVRGGGTLLVTGETAWRDQACRQRPSPAMDSFLGIRTLGRETAYDVNTISGYFRPGSDPLFRALAPTFEYPMPGTFLKVEATDAAVVGHVAVPLAVETPDSFMGWQPLPPSPDNRWPGLTVVTRGKGRAYYCVAPLGRLTFQGARWAMLLVEDLARVSGAGTGIGLEGPGALVDMTCHRRGSQLVVHLLNRTPAVGRRLLEPLPGVTLVVDPARQPEVRTAALAYPETGPLDVERGPGVLRVALPPLGIHTIVTLSP
jgi:hypothetical protein